MLLLERVIGEAKIVESDRTKLPDGVLCRVKEPVCNIDELNANNRKYGWDVIEKVTGDKTLSEQMSKRALFGHAEHPDTSQSKLDLVSHVVLEWVVDKDNNTVYQVFDVLDTPTGRIVDCLIRAQCGVGVSTRAEGELTEEVDPTTKKKFHRVIAEKYKYITTDFTADPSTFGTKPMEVRRNVVESIKSAVLCEKATTGDKQFASAVLNSMLCKHGRNEKDGKCESCGCCKAIKEASFQIVADPSQGLVNVSGDVGAVNIAPTSTDMNPGGAVSITVTANPVPVQAAQPVVDEPVSATPEQLDDEASKAKEFEDKLKSELGQDETTDDKDEIGERVAKLTAGFFKNSGYKPGDNIEEKLKLYLSKRRVDEQVDIWSKEQADDWDISKFSVTKRLRDVGYDDIKKALHEPTFQRDGEVGVWVGEIDGNVFMVDVNGKTVTISADDPKVVESVIDYLDLADQWSKPAAVGVPNESKKPASAMLKEIAQLKVDLAVARAERDKLTEAVNKSGDVGLQFRVAMSKIREMKKSEGGEVTALRTKLEEKAKLASDLQSQVMANAATAEKLIKENHGLMKKIDEMTVGNEKLLKENKEKIESVEKGNKKALDEQVNKAKTNATCAVIKEYAEQRLKGFKSVHDNVRALLEGCKTIAEVDEVLDDIRESTRRDALHSNPPKEITVHEDKTGTGGDVGRRVGIVFEGFGMS